MRWHYATGAVMLQGKLLEYIVRRSPLQESLVRLAWPSLSTESRLQVVQAIQDSEVDGAAPQWLLELALDDAAAIVRFWAARNERFFDDAAKSWPNWITEKMLDARLAASPMLNAYRQKASELRTKADADPEWLVRACTRCGNAITFATLTAAPQQNRLVFLRTLEWPELSSFAEWLGEALASNVPDEELNDCAQEFFAHPDVQRKLKRETWEFSDGAEAYFAGKGLKAAWDVVRKAGPKLCHTLAFYLPTSLGLTAVAADELATLPEDVVVRLIHRRIDSKEIQDLIETVRNSPERFSESICDALRRADDIADDLSPDDAARERLMGAVDRSQVMLDSLLEMRERLTALSEKVEGLTETRATKRGFFG